MISNYRSKYLSKYKEIMISRFERIQQSLNCALNDNTIQEYLNDYGFTTEKLSEGKSLAEKA